VWDSPDKKRPVALPNEARVPIVCVTVCE